MQKLPFPLKNKVIPTQLTEAQFNEFICSGLSIGSRGPRCCIPLYKVFNYILTVIYTGMQWKKLPIDKKESGNEHPRTIANEAGIGVKLKIGVKQWASLALRLLVITSFARKKVNSLTDGMITGWFQIGVITTPTDFFSNRTDFDLLLRLIAFTMI